jgi:hypothetical protein
MKQKIRSIILSFLSIIISASFMGSGLALAAANPAYNGVQCSGAAAASPVCHTSGTDPLTGKNGIIVKATNILAFVSGVAAIVIIIIAGISFMTSSGDAAKAGKARMSIIYASAGLVIIVLARAIVTFIVSRV